MLYPPPSSEKRAFIDIVNSQFLSEKAELSRRIDLFNVLSLE